MLIALLVDEGVLLERENKEFESYNKVYDKKYGYYDEGQYYKRLKEKDEVIKDAKKYVEDGVDNTYVVVSKTLLPDEVDVNTVDVEDENYYVEDVIYSVAKMDGKIVENFVRK
ncbi:hypothetical protein N5B56_01590 [Eubacterium sp. LFL-14]|uniref:Uncharacterized protein n=1 Tax=Eubacterium album TaxID=2978477 RepID=A0ABT2LWW4_9FIRM|nr:hypothetical protein [Eubacterium sp. LFL-14]MCT7397779.1 hypothetical protein [Eubacterium sp. LFL-14]